MPMMPLPVTNLVTALERLQQVFLLPARTRCGRMIRK
jgi:hypothetical protein